MLKVRLTASVLFISLCLLTTPAFSMKREIAATPAAAYSGSSDDLTQLKSKIETILKEIFERFPEFAFIQLESATINQNNYEALQPYITKLQRLASYEHPEYIIRQSVLESLNEILTVLNLNKGGITTFLLKDNKQLTQELIEHQLVTSWYSLAIMLMLLVFAFDKMSSFA